MPQKCIIQSTLFKYKRTETSGKKQGNLLDHVKTYVAIPECLIERVLYKYFCLKSFQLQIMFLSLLAKLHKVLNSHLFQLRKQFNSFPFDMSGPELASIGRKVYREFQDKIPFEIKGIRYQIFPVFLFIVQLLSQILVGQHKRNLHSRKQEGQQNALKQL